MIRHSTVLGFAVFIFVASFATLAFSQDSSSKSSSYRPEEVAYLATSDQTRQVAQKYFDAYLARDWNAVETLVSDDVSFGDPTAVQLFGPNAHVGKAAAIKSFRETYAGLTHMKATVSRTMFASHYAIFESTLDWSVKLKGGKELRTPAMPFVVIVTVRDGKVVEHRDYADYRGFVEAIASTRK